MEGEHEEQRNAVVLQHRAKAAARELRRVVCAFLHHLIDPLLLGLPQACRPRVQVTVMQPEY